MVHCVQYSLVCVDESKRDTAFSSIETALNNLVSKWENNGNKNIHSKGFEVRTNEYRIGGIQRMSDTAEKNSLYNHIKGILNPPFIKGYVKYHLCGHDSNNPSRCVITEIFEG